MFCVYKWERILSLGMDRSWTKWVTSAVTSCDLLWHLQWVSDWVSSCSFSLSLSLCLPNLFCFTSQLVAAISQPIRKRASLPNLSLPPIMAPKLLLVSNQLLIHFSHSKHKPSLPTLLIQQNQPIFTKTSRLFLTSCFSWSRWERDKKFTFEIMHKLAYINTVFHPLFLKGRKGVKLAVELVFVFLCWIGWGWYGWLTDPQQYWGQIHLSQTREHLFVQPECEAVLCCAVLCLCDRPAGLSKCELMCFRVSSGTKCDFVLMLTLQTVRKPRAPQSHHVIWRHPDGFLPSRHLLAAVPSLPL